MSTEGAFDPSPCWIHTGSGTIVPLWRSSPRHRQQHRVEKAFFLTPCRVEGREGVGEAQEVGAALLLRLEKRTQGIGPAAGLEEHRGVYAVQGGGLAGGSWALVRHVSARSLPTTPAAPTQRGRAGLHVGKEHPLERVGRRRLSLEPCGHGLR